METDVDIVQTVPLFRDLPQEDVEQLLDLLTRRSFKAGDEIVRSGRVQDGLSAGYLVLSGQVQLSLQDDEGRYVPLDIVECGEYFGEQAVDVEDPGHVAARALTPVTVVLYGLF